MADDAVWVPVLPSMNNFGAMLARGAAGAGRQAGEAAGQGIADGIAGARAAVEKATAALAKSQDKVADSAGKRRIAEAALLELQEKGITSGARHTRAVEALEAARRRETAAAGDARRAVDQLAAAEDRAANATDNMSSAAERSSGGFKSMFSGLDGGVKSLAGLAAGAAGVSGAMDLMGKAMEQEKSISKLNASLGASGAMAKDFGTAAKGVFASGVGDSMSEVADAVGLVQSSFHTLGFEGDASLEQATTRAVNFANVFDADIASSVQAASTLVTEGLAKDSTEAFDLLTKSFQTVPAAMRDELPEIIQEYGTNFRALGFDGKESFNLLVSAAGQGKFALDKTGDALKEFTIRGSDMSKASADAYSAIGLNAEEMSNRVAAGGDGAQAALQETAAGLLKIEDPAARANAAIALFGTPLEDLSVDQIPAFLEGLSGAPDAMADFAGATDQMGDTLNDNAASKLETFKRGIESSIVGVLGDQALPMMSEFTGSLEENEGSMLATIAGMTGMGGALAGFEQAKGVFDSAKEGVLGLKDGFLQAKDTAQQAWSSVQAGAGWVKAKGQAVASFVQTSASATVEAVKTGAAWTGAQVKAGAGWVAAKAAAVGTFIAMSVSATVEAVKTSSAWVASNARTAGSFLIARGAMVATAVATGAMTAAQWLLNAAMSANPIGIIVIAIAALVGGIILAYQHSETFRNIVQGAWEGIKTAASFAWESVLKPALDGFVSGIGWVGDKAIWLKDTVTDAVGWIGQKFEDVVGFVTGMPGRIAGAAGGMWDGITSAFKSAINAIIGGWNSIEFKVPGFKIGPVGYAGFTLGLPDIPMLARGGVAGRRGDGSLFGPGTGTSDSILGLDKLGLPTALVSAGEGVVTESAMGRGGSQLVAALNAGWTPTADFLHALLGGDFRSNSLGVEEDSPFVAGALSLSGFLKNLPRFAAGGVVTASDLVDFARGVEGAEYDWGGVNWGDCSGAVSALANKAAGWEPFGSRFATGNEGDELAKRGALPGVGPAGSLSFGWYNGGPYGGHTAATLPDGTHFEMGGARGDGQFGGQAVGADWSEFTDHAHFPPEFFLGGDPKPTGDMTADAPIFDAAPTTGGGSPIGTSTAPSVSGGGSTAPSASSGSSSSSSGGSSMTLSDYVGQTASDFATGTTKDTLDFFGLGKLADLPIIPKSDASPAIAPAPSTAPADDLPAPAQPGGNAPLVNMEKVETFDVDELVRLIRTELNHLVRSDAFTVGGWSG